MYGFTAITIHCPKLSFAETSDPRKKPHPTKSAFLNHVFSIASFFQMPLAAPIPIPAEAALGAAE